MERKLLIFALFLPSLLWAQNPKAVRLKQWMGVIGNTSNESLGGDVLGIIPSANLPYRAAVSRFDTNGNEYIDFFHLQSQTDTIAGLTLQGGLHPVIGDFNNDGYQDLAVTKESIGYDTVYVYWGTPAGIDTLNPLKIPGENRYDYFMPICAGDVNNDGKTDLIITASQFEHQRGKVYVYLNPVTKSIPDYTIVGDTVISYNASWFGANCAIADLNNDGYQDLIVRGTKGPDPQDSIYYDYVNIYWGTGKNSLPDFVHPLQIRSYNPYGSLNFGITCFDVNGDGIPDLLWGALDTAGRWINIHYGGNNFSTTPSFRLKSMGAPSFGSLITDGGDMNGRGYDDIVVGCPEATYTAGFVFVYSGGPKIDSTFDAAVGVQGLYHASSFGGSVSSVGDVSGDGLSDIIVGAPSYPSFQFHDTQGFWGIFLGDSAMPTFVKERSRSVPVNFELYQAYPNPFNPTTTISYQLPSFSFVTLKIYDVVGREIRTLVQEVEKPGRYDVKFDGAGLSSGVYFYRLIATTKDGTSFIQIKKLALIK